MLHVNIPKPLIAGLVTMMATITHLAAAQSIDLSMVLSRLDDSANSWSPIVPQLRQHGGAAIDSLLALRRLVEGETESSDFERRVAAAARLSRLDELVDLVANQWHASSSALFWLDSIEDAQQAARRSHRPVLVLLRPPAPANPEAERLFAVGFYANQRIAELLRSRFALCAPIFETFGEEAASTTVDVRSYLHLIVDSSGRPIDAFVGLGTPKQFEDWLLAGHKLTNEVYQLSDEAHRAALSAAHRDRVSSGSASPAKTQLDVAARVLLERLRPWPSPDPAVAEITTDQELEALLTECGQSAPTRQISELFAEGVFTRNAGVLEQKLRTLQ